VQIVPVVAPVVESLTVYQRTANWCTPLNNGPITPDEQARLRAEFEVICETVNTSPHGFLHRPHDRVTFDDSEDDRRAFFEKMWNSPGFSKLTSNYTDLARRAAADGKGEFLAEKIRGRRRPVTAAKPDPGPPLGRAPPPSSPVTTRHTTSRTSHWSISRNADRPHDRTRIETAEGMEPDRRVGTGFDFGTGALLRMGIRGRDGVPLEQHWADGPRTFLGVQTSGFPSLFFPGGPHAAAGNNPRYNGDQVDFVTDTLIYVREHGFDAIEVDPAAEEEWTSMVDRNAAKPPSFGQQLLLRRNIPGKPRWRYLLTRAAARCSSQEIDRLRD
jgi:cation diffusion facilitator CzcD-associated flavoprotein CzcO